MPLEIRELVIKVNVNEGAGSGNSSSATAGSSSNTSNDKKAIIAECLEQVMDVLQKKKER